MAISRAQMLKELLPGLNALFGFEYEKYEEDILNAMQSGKFVYDMTGAAR